MQDTGHAVSEKDDTTIARVDTIITYFLLPGDYVVAIDDADVLSLREVNRFPGLRLTKIGSQLSIHIPTCDTDDECIVCYILDNYMSWILKLEAYTKLISLIDTIDIDGNNVNVKVNLDGHKVLEKDENNSDEAEE